MNSTIALRVKHLPLFLAVSALTLMISIPAFGAGGGVPIEDPAADTTNKVAETATTYRWFYWPGWAFAGLTLTVLAVLAFAYYKSVYAPSRRGNKAKA